MLEKVCASLVEEINPTEGGRREFRRTMVVNHFLRFYHLVKEMLTSGNSTDHHFYAKSGNQIFSDVSTDQHVDDSIGRPIPHLSADKHVTGEAIYIDDIPKMTGKH